MPQNQAIVASGLQSTLLRQNLLLVAQKGSTWQDRIDCAKVALTAGERRIARALCDIAFLRSGFAPARLHWQQRELQIAGFEDAIPVPEQEILPVGSMTDLAIEELIGLFRTISALPPSQNDTLSSEGSLNRPGDGNPLPGNAAASAFMKPSSRQAPPLTEVVDACMQLCALLREPRSDTADRALTTTLAGLNVEFLKSLPFDPTADVEDLEKLAANCLAADLRDFLIRNYALAFPPFGSAAILHAAARLSPMALGPYFANVPRIIRAGRDVLGLIQLGAHANSDPATLGQWVALVTTNLDEESLLDLIDALGDRGLTRLLWSLFWPAAFARHPDRGSLFLWRLRDAALDVGDYGLAIITQRTLAQRASGDKTEWTVLSEICATDGEFEQAENALAIASQLEPPDPSYPARAYALKRRDSAAFAVTGGFGSPTWRTELRSVWREKVRNDLPGPPPQ